MSINPILDGRVEGQLRIVSSNVCIIMPQYYPFDSQGHPFSNKAKHPVDYSHSKRIPVKTHMLHKYYSGKFEPFLQPQTTLISVSNKRTSCRMEHYWKFLVTDGATCRKLYTEYGHFVLRIQ